MMEQSLTQTKIEEIFDIPNELITVLASDDIEFQVLRECTAMQNKLNKLWESNENRIKDEIIALTADYDNKKSAVDQLNAAESAEKLAKCKETLKSVSEDKVQVQSKTSDLRQALAKCEEEGEQLEVEKDTVLNNTTKVIPEKRHDINLYHYMTGVRWQYDCPQQEVKGYVANKKAVKPFCLNSAQNSQFFIANYLWDLIENEWE